MSSPNAENIRPSVSASNGKAIRFLIGGAMLLLHVLVFAFAMTVTRYLGTFCSPIFLEFDLELPAMTLLAMNITNFINSKWFLILPGFLLIDGIVIGCLSITSDNLRWMRSLWNTFMLCGFILYLAFLAIAFLIPFIGLIKGLDGGKTAANFIPTSFAESSFHASPPR